MNRDELNKSIADQRLVCLDSQLKFMGLVAEKHTQTIDEVASIIKNVQENQQQIIELSVKTDAIESALDRFLRKLGGLVTLLEANQDINQSESTHLQVDRNSNINESSLASVAGTDQKDCGSIAASLNVDNLSNSPHSAKPDKQSVGEKGSVVSSKGVQHKVSVSDDDISAVMQKETPNVVEESKQEKAAEDVLAGAQQSDNILFKNVRVLSLEPKIKKSTTVGSFCVEFVRLPTGFKLTFTEDAGAYYYYLKRNEKILLSKNHPAALTFYCYCNEKMIGNPDALLLHFGDVADKHIAHAFIGKSSH